MNSSKKKYQKLVLTGLFIAIIFLLAFTPIGYIQLPLIKATLVHVPVILGAILLGPQYGAILGFSFGLTSLISNTTAPTLLSFAFTPAVNVPGSASGSILSLIICFVPRILVGIVPYYIYQLFQKLFKQNKKGQFVSLAMGGIIGAFTNTALVMGLIYVLFRNAYAAAKGISVSAVAGVVLGVVGTNGVMEAIVAAVLVTALGKALLPFMKKNNLS